MCFEWDERYRREQAERLSKEKADELIRRTQENARASQQQSVPQSSSGQPASEQAATA